MKWNRNTGLAVLLIACGAFILLSQLGLKLGNVFGILIPAAMIFLGYYGIRNGRPRIGWIVMTIGMIILVGKLWGLLALLVPIALIWFGWSILKNRSKVY